MIPEISIIIPCYNADKYLRQALESVRSQSLSVWECIIVNDGSTDHSEEIAKEYINKDIRFKYIYQENSGAGAARNTGMEQAQGEYILLLDADDWISDICVEKVVSFFKENTNASMFNLKSIWIDEQSHKEIPGHSYIDYRHVLVYGQDNKMAFRKKEIVNHGGFDESMRHGFEDWEFYIRQLSPSSIVKVSDDVLYYYRVNVSQNNVSAIGEHNKLEIMKYIYKKNIDKYMEFLGAPQLQYQWFDRRLPQIAYKIQIWFQQMYDKINRLL